MKLIIDIPEEVYKSIQDNDYCGISNSDMYNVVKNGTPLPKGHGDLISRQAVIDMLNKLIEVEQKQGTDVMNYGRERVNAYESILDEIESDYLFPSMPSAEKTTLSAEKTTITDTDLISRDYTIQQIQKAKESNYNFNYNTLIDFIKVLPSAEQIDSSIPQEDVADILNTVESALKGTNYEVVGYDNTDGFLKVLIDMK